jgi:ribosomal protein S18 acetylase RimI-like enzyme
VNEVKSYAIRELGPDTWTDFEKLAPKQGTCWCMYYHRERPLSKSIPREQRVALNKKDKERLVREDRSHAALVYDGETLAGWCQYGLKEELPRIDAGRNYKKIGPPAADQELWRITCFFVAKAYRGKEVAEAALDGALESIKKRGGGIVEAYPVVNKKLIANPEWVWFGTPRMFQRHGFKPIDPLGTSYMLMRKTIG